MAERRRHAGRAADRLSSAQLPDDAIGFGLSGGGVRSATFCLGVFQSLARSQALRRIDFLSTVSGGGYFGAFLGRLFTRPWISGPPDVEQVLAGVECSETGPTVSAWAPRVFRWLRDNGRYLAPRGSGDLLVLGALLLRNWLAIQTVLIVSALTAFAFAQVGRIALERIAAAASTGMSAWTTCAVLGGGRLVAWSPWLLTSLVPLTLVALPAGWGYWLVQRNDDGMRGVPAIVGVLLTAALGLGGVVHYIGSPHSVRLFACAFAAAAAALTLLFYATGEIVVRVVLPQPDASDADSGNRLRTAMTRVLKTGLVCAAALLLFGTIDSVAGTVYTVSRSGEMWPWISGVTAAFAAAGAFARPLYVLLAPRGRGARPRIAQSVLLWIAAVVVAIVWLTTIDVGAYALRWGFETPACTAADTEPLLPPFLAGSTVVLALYTLLFGHTRRFLNLSSVHGFYTARLTRTFLGASNETRLGAGGSPVSDTEHGDDCSSAAYWQWPMPMSDRPGVDVPPGASRPWQKGGPLHFVNVTVNETVDARSGIQNQDRKGTGLAVGPCGLSLGIRHHLMTDGDAASGATTVGGATTSDTRTWRVFPSDPRAHHVFPPDATAAPEPLTLGRWTSISGAAFSTAAGAATSVPLALLCGLFNVRLGYWWHSQTGFKGRWIERLLPVQSALFAELLARTHGTAGQLWNISDGGHFENMGGYELLRRRLPLIVIVDAEADPDYAFQGLSDLVRKARLDFEAEINFLEGSELDAVLPASARPHFGAIEALRRARREDRSGAHAALARVWYGRGEHAFASWMVYVKATLVGDEPEDVVHYHRSHPDFPQETTLDQFFDESQWESYRRLGEHVGHRVLTPELLDHLSTGTGA